MRSSKWKGFLRGLVILVVTFVMMFVQPLMAMAEGGGSSSTENERTKKIIISDDLIYKYSAYQIMFYNGKACYDVKVAILPGDNLEEKIWNYIANAGISGISDNPAAIAGIMGNMSHETGGTYNPFIQSPTGCTGLIQWCSGNVAFFDYMSARGFDAYYFVGTAPEIDEAIIDDGLMAELDFLFEKVPESAGDTIGLFTPKLDVPNNKFGAAGARGYADLFLVTVEKAVGGADSIEDDGVAAIATSTKYQGAADRRNRAEQIYNKYANSGGSGCGEGATGDGTGVTWSNGWINADTFPGYAKEEAQGSGYAVHDSMAGQEFETSDKKPNKILLHSTEGTGIGLSAYGKDRENGGSIYPAHFIIDGIKKEVHQHYPINISSAAIRTYDRKGPIQIEIVGYSTSEYTSNNYYLRNLPDDAWDYIALLVIAISEETGIPLTTSVDWASPSRISESEFKTYSGIIGHMHVPDNDHADPGNIWSLLEAAIARNPNAGKIGCGGRTKRVCL